MSFVRNINYSVSGFQLHVPEWELLDKGVTALWGPSGSGKTTICRILSGIISCPTFSWCFDNQDIAGLSPKQKNLGVVFQSYDLFPHLSALENILLVAQARGQSQGAAQEQSEILLQDLGLWDLRTKKAGNISSGEQQRVALARAIVGRPRFLIMDEPFSSLDEENRVKARQLVKKVLTDFDIPALLISHDKRDLEELAGRICEIQQGKILHCKNLTNI